jgi:hypothetical protein
VYTYQYCSNYNNTSLSLFLSTAYARTRREGVKGPPEKHGEIAIIREMQAGTPC